jgi:hypothetical protein
LNPFVLEYTPYPSTQALLEPKPRSGRIGRLRFHSKHLTKLNSRPIRFSKIVTTHRRCFQSTDLLRASKGV